MTGRGAELAKGKHPPPALHLAAPRPAGTALARIAARQGRRPELLGVLVRSVQAEAPRLGRPGSAGAARTSSSWASTPRTSRRRPPVHAPYDLTYPNVHDGPGEHPAEVRRDGLSRDATSSTGAAASSASASRARSAPPRLPRDPERARVVRALAAAVAAMALLAVSAGPAAAGERHPTLGELEGEVMCPTCKTTLDQSTRRSPIGSGSSSPPGSPPATRRARSSGSSSRSSGRPSSPSRRSTASTCWPGCCRCSGSVSVQSCSGCSCGGGAEDASRFRRRGRRRSTPTSTAGSTRSSPGSTR